MDHEPENVDFFRVTWLQLQSGLPVYRWSVDRGVWGPNTSGSEVKTWRIFRSRNWFTIMFEELHRTSWFVGGRVEITPFEWVCFMLIVFWSRCSEISKQICIFVFLKLWSRAFFRPVCYSLVYGGKIREEVKDSQTVKMSKSFDGCGNNFLAKKWGCWRIWKDWSHSSGGSVQQGFSDFSLGAWFWDFVTFLCRLKLGICRWCWRHRGIHLDMSKTPTPPKCQYEVLENLVL